jgi:tetratricopeptide (TPR) repeat protein
VVKDRDRAEVISYEPLRKERIPPPQLEPQFPAADQCTAEQLYLKGYYAQKHWNPDAAVALFERALKLDPGLTGALRAMAIHYYKTGRYEEALNCADKVLLRDDDDLTARYYRALAKIQLGIDERTEEDLELVGRRAAYRHVAPYPKAALAVKRQDWRKAKELLAGTDSGDARAAVMLAAILRRGGEADRARKLVDRILADDPLNPLALVERSLAGNAEGLTLLRDDPQEYLEGACAYAEMNLWGEATAVLRIGEKCQAVAGHPFFWFYLGYMADRKGEAKLARESYERGVGFAADYVFPSRAEDSTVLRTGLKYLPDDWKLHYYLGLLLTASMRWEEGSEQFLTAQRASPKHAPLYWCLGEVYRQKLHDSAKAIAAYERALACNPSDCHYYIALDALYAAQKMNEKRQQMYAAAPEAVLRDYRVLLRKAIWHVDLGQYDQALAILRATTFHPWEGWTGAREVYVRALRLRAGEHMKQRRFEPAIEDLKAAMQWPENLGSGRPANVDESYECYQMGMGYKEVGDLAQAKECFQKARRSGSEWGRKADEELKNK